MPTLPRLPRRVPARLAALCALLAVGSASASAQTSSAWSVCFTSAVGSCSYFSLTTTPTLDAMSVRTGTLVDVLVRYQQAPGVVSGLQDFAFYFSPAGTGIDLTPIAFTPQALFGAPPVPPGGEDHWVGQGFSTVPAPADPTENSVAFQNPLFDQFIAGCQGGNFDANIQSPLATCGGGAYRFTFNSAAQFDADAVTEIAVDLYAGDNNGDQFPDIAVCSAPTDGGPSTGFDFGDFSAGDVCRVAPASTVTPEPASVVLVASGLLALGGLARRRRIA